MGQYRTTTYAGICITVGGSDYTAVTAQVSFFGVSDSSAFSFYT
jgi:hypothetical protein